MSPNEWKPSAEGAGSLNHNLSDTHAFEKRGRGRPAASTLLLALLALVFVPTGARASSPASGTLGPHATAPVRWSGTVAGSVNPVPPSHIRPGGPVVPCQEGVNCDTFRLRIGGVEADWSEKVARLRIDWTLPSTDYDLYVYVETPYGLYPINQSTRRSLDGTNSTHEALDIRPVFFSDTPEYLVRVVYVNATAGDQYRGAAVAVQIPGAESPCRLPGLTVLEDLDGDAQTALASHDIERVSIAEPSTAGPDRLVFTLKVGDLRTLTPETSWRVYFRTPNVAGEQYFVDMRTDLAGLVSYKYGVGGATLGDADAGNYDPQAGSISITVSTDKIGEPRPGQYPAQKLDQIYMHVTAGALVVDSAPSRDVVLSQASYEPVGNASCNAAPTVVITGPAEGTTFVAPASITVEADAFDADGQVARVDFYQGDTLLGSAADAPYSFTWENVAPGSYALTAVATDAQGAAAVSAVVNVTVQAPPPAAPTGLTATGVGSSGLNKSVVTLAWEDNSGDEQVFHVERSTSAAGGFAEIATVAANVTTFADRDVQSKQTYYYRVRAGNAAGRSAYSNTASVYVK